jgi:peptide/nickel transport system substrate-binding protein
MDRISRRRFVGGVATAAATASFHAPSVRAQKEAQTLNFIAEANLKVFDPIWSTAYITRNHGYLVYDTLFGIDGDSRVRPQMVDRVAPLQLMS